LEGGAGKPRKKSKGGINVFDKAQSRFCRVLETEGEREERSTLKRKNTGRKLKVPKKIPPRGKKRKRDNRVQEGKLHT